MASPIASSAFNRLSQYASSPVIMAYCYAELAVSSLAVAETITSIYCAYPRRNGQAELLNSLTGSKINISTIYNK